jgi:hypothetical protein
VHDFSLAGIRDVEPTGEYFTRPNGFDPEDHFSGRFHALKGNEHHRVELEINADKAPYFRRKEYHGSQTIIENRDDCTLRVAFDVASLNDIAAFIRSWAPACALSRPRN